MVLVQHSVAGWIIKGPENKHIQALISVAETLVEAGATRAIGGEEAYNEFSYGETFLKNFGINVATGGIGSKGKWGH